MKLWNHKLVPILFALAGVLFLVPTVKQVIQGESITASFLVLGMTFFVFTLIFLVADRKSGGSSGPPSA